MKKPTQYSNTLLWWNILRSIAILNISLWFICALSSSYSGHYTLHHAILSGIFTLVCAFRSFFPRIDLERYCLVDSFASSMVLGRSAATIAEISFATQIALFLHDFGLYYARPGLGTCAIVIVFLLCSAQIFCWLGITTRNHLWHGIEESLWALSFGIVGIALYTTPFDGQWIWIGQLGPLTCLGYVMFMLWIDVPMYIQRWQQERHETTYLSFRNGFSDALYTRIVTKEWRIWKEEVAWLTGYFSFAVWISIFIFIYIQP